MKLTSQQKKSLIYSLLINDVIYILMGLFFYAAYECQLDEMIRAAICGVSGTKTPYILYSHILIGWILKGLTIALPSFNWCYAYLSICVLAALSLICYVIIKRTDNKIGLTVSAVLVSFAGYECYVLPGCIKTAVILGVASLVLFMDATETGAIKKTGRKILVAFLATLGSMVQFSALCITIIIGLISLGTYYAAQSNEKFFPWIKTQRKSKVFRPFVVTALSMFLMITLVWVTDYFSYQLSGRADAGRYRLAMIRMYGYGMGDYDAVYQDKYGIDAEEYSAIKNGSFGALNDEGWKKLEGLSKEVRKISGKEINSYFKTVPLTLFKKGIFYLWLIMLFTLFFSPVEGAIKKKIIWMQAGLLVLCFLAAYFLYAWQNNWLAFTFILSLLPPLILALKGARETDYQYVWVFLTIFSVILYSNFSSGMVSSVSEENMSERFAALDTNKVNVIDLNTYFRVFGAKNVFPENILQVGNIRVSNGAYALMDGFDGKVFSTYPTENEVYEWVYNPKQIDISNLVFED